MEKIEDRDLLQTVFDSAPNGIMIMQPISNGSGKVEDFSILLLNAYVLTWVGNADYKGKRFADIFPAIKDTTIFDSFRQVAETGTPQSIEHQYNSNGVNNWYSFAAALQGALLVITIENITARKLVEFALAKTLETAERQTRLYESITNNTPDLAYVFDLNYRFAYANKAILKMWGKTAEKAIGKGLRENGYEEWHALMHEREIDEVAATKKPIRGTVSFPHAELGSRIYDYILTPVIDDQGVVEAVSGITRDITDFKYAEENLRQSESRYKNIIEQAPLAIVFLVGKDLLVENPNQNFIDMVGKDWHIMGKSLRHNRPDVTIENRPMLQILDDVFTSGKAFQFFGASVKTKHEDVTTEHYYNLNYSPLFDTEQKVWALLGIASDATEEVMARKKIEESEARLKSVIDQTPAATLVLSGSDLVIEQINKSMLLFIGQGEEIIGRPLIDVLPELKGQYVWSQVERVYKEGISFDQSEVPVPHTRNGILEDHYYNLAYRPRRENGEITGMIQVAVDVTEQVTARKKLEESERRYRMLNETLEQQVDERTHELQRSNEDLQQFAHVTSHDLKEPVRKIKTFTNRLEQNLAGKLDADAARFLERINVATDRMFNMIDGVLTYSTTNAGIENCGPVDLNEIIKSIETDLEIPLQATNAKLESTALPTLEGAPVLLYQLFYNLISNSIKFVPSGTAPHISISSKSILLNGEDFAHITLRDNGIGFEGQYADHIFETFTRLNSKDNYEGTGLGLALCKKIVTRHGGSITAAGHPGQGATFTIMLPVKQTQPAI